MRNSNKIYNHIWNSLLMIAIITNVGLIVYTNLFHYCYEIDADIASEAVLARLIWESGEWIPRSWYPGSELRFWQTPDLAALFYGITHNMSMSMGIACIVMAAGILISAYFLVSQISFDKTQKLAFLLLCLVIPNNILILELLYVFASYYAIHVIILFITLGIYARLINGKSTHSLWLGIAVLLSFMLGMQGVRGILIINGPLLVTEMFRQLYLIYIGHRWNNKKNLFVFGWCALLLIAGYAGTLLPFSIGQGTSRNIRKSIVKLLERVLPDMAICLGWPQIGFGMIIYVGLLLIITMVLILCIVKILKKQCSDHTTWIYFMLFISAPITALIVMFTTTESSHRYFFMIYFAMAFGYTYFLNLIREKSRILSHLGYLTIFIVFIFQLNTFYRPIIQSEDLAQTPEYEVSQYLKDNGYLTAYATFESANTMTVLSGGTVRVAAVASVAKMDVCRCLSSSDWYVPNVPYESITAYIVTEKENEEFSELYKQHHEDIQLVTQIDKYLIYVSDYNYSCIE